MGRACCLIKIQHESPGCPTVVSQNHAVCLAAEYGERRRSPRFHKLEDTDAEDETLSPVLIYNGGLGDRSTVAVSNLICSKHLAACHLGSHAFLLRQHFSMPSRAFRPEATNLLQL